MLAKLAVGGTVRHLAGAAAVARDAAGAAGRGADGETGGSGALHGRRAVP